MATNLTQDDESKLEAAFAGFDAQRAGAEEGLEVFGGTKDLFCEHWPKAKQVLSFLLDVPIPMPAKLAIRVVIRAGDLAHSTIC
jgi:hypothetical protein